MGFRSHQRIAELFLSQLIKSGYQRRLPVRLSPITILMCFPDHVQSLQVTKTRAVVFSADSTALEREESPQEQNATERPLKLPSIANLIIATPVEPLQVGEAIQIPEPPEPDTSELRYPCDVEESPCNPLWPLRDRREVLLIQHFINHLSLWFDYCDKDRHFKTVIVQTASTHFVLLNALLAISCKHLSQTQPEKWIPGEADDYQARCLQSYIPALAHPGSARGFTTGVLCAITMILRLYEEMTVPSVDDRPYGHILDTNIFTLPESPDDPNYSLCRACLLVAIRQEIFISFVARTPPPRLAERCGITRTLEPTSDFDWAWRIITFTEDVLIFAYGPDARSIGSWENLRAYLHQWMEKRPASFNPLWQTGSDREAFPEIIFANDFHIAGQQHAIICQIMLLTHDPRMPVLGLDKAMASKAVEEEIRRLIRQICGIALSAGEWQPATIAAGMTVAMCGHLFHEPAEQEKLLDILAKSEAHMGWSLLRQEEKLKAFWECNAEQ
ncbi:ArcA-like protein [Colletotrichum scovillei]|uniref:ArcA-like protein n=1 Tax=Colletotrichum scovillei TaxID=1209932 RepID=A0A9P7U5S7_9PEZI|nr:ArcA-like protein [Colletotrichum scovillei]KAG7040543.1 ArcA-like protein [Colletotrichum scovillei]KAG7060591.1 ArcA-like protein [Colletotrichum scovillei]